VTGIELRRLALPLRVPYRLSYRTFEVFEPFLVRVTDADGRRGFGEGHISPGSSAETREQGWPHCVAEAMRIVGLDTDAAMELLERNAGASPVASSAVITAVEMLAGHPLLDVDEAVRLPILTPTAALHADAIAREVDEPLGQGFTTFKVKVGTDVAADSLRVAAYQASLRGRGTLRLDANRAWTRDDACRFAAALDPAGIELFEQPCAAADWDANAAVAAVSSVPLMLDEPICSLDDVDRAAAIDGVALCKVKLKRFGSLSRLDRVLTHIRAAGLRPVLGDGLGCEPACWMEACVARSHVDSAGEFNGFLKPRSRLFARPLRFEQGCVVLEPGFPTLDETALDAHTVERIVFGAW
jgi:L-alanine-DL-glutamate epimerase-like enolase superfamily enzyme